MARPGGVQRHVRDLSDWLIGQGHEVRIIAPPAPGAARRSEGALTELGRARRLAVHGTAFELSLAAPWATQRVARALRDWGAELVHLHTPWTPWLAGQMWRALRLPTVTTIHATLPEARNADFVDRYIRRSARRFLRASQAVITPSPAPVPLLQELVPDLAPVILPPAVDLSALRPGEKNGTRLLFLGRLEPRKGVDVVLSAWPRIAQACPEVTLIVAGDGPLRGDVQATPGLTYRPAPTDAELRALMAAADLFIAPAPYGESYGLVLAEAMAAGAVPVAAANAGYAHVLRGLPELLVPPGDAAALAARIGQLIGAPAQRAQLQNRARATAATSDVATQGPAYAALFQDVIRQAGTPPR
jgi:phosphatidylinositol alpha-mannosyltransferase